MKKVFALVLFVSFSLVSCAFAFSFSGIADKVFEGGIETLVSIVVAGIMTVAGTLFGKKIKAWRATADEGVDVVMALYKGMKPSSPGGKKLTDEEIRTIIIETEHFGAAFAKAWAETHPEPFKPSP